MIPEFLPLIAGLIVVLTVASTVAGLLRWRAGATPTLTNLTARINAWWVMVLVIATPRTIRTTVSEVKRLPPGVTNFAQVASGGSRRNHSPGRAREASPGVLSAAASTFAGVR